MNRNAVIFIGARLQGSQEKEQLPLRNMAKQMKIKIIDIIHEKPLALTGLHGLSFYILDKRIRDVIIHDPFTLGSTVIDSINFIEELTSLGVAVHICNLDLSTRRKTRVNTQANVVLRAFKDLLDFQALEKSKKIKRGVSKYRKSKKRWGRLPGSVKSIDQLKREYKSIIKDLEERSTQSLRSIARKRNVALATVIKLDKIFIRGGHHNRRKNH